MMIQSRCSKLLLLCLVTSVAVIAQQTRDPLPVPDIPGYRTMKCDFHMHTVFSDGNVWPTTRVNEAWRDGLDAIAITDHDGSIYHRHFPDVPEDLRRPMAIASEAAAQQGIVLVPAVEITRGTLHFNALFVQDPNAFGKLDFLSALQQAKKQGAYVFWNHPDHPRRQAKTVFDSQLASAHKAGLIQGAELINGYVVFSEALPLIQEKNLALLANSDVHGSIEGDFTLRTRPITLLFVKSADASGIREALEARRTVGWVNGQLWGSEALLRALWESSIKSNKAIVKAFPDTRVFFEIQNISAIPFQITVKEMPAWLRVGFQVPAKDKPAWVTLGAFNVKPESIHGITLAISKDAPAGKNKVVLQLEVQNLHAGPERNLTVGLPLEIEITPQRAALAE